MSIIEDSEENLNIKCAIIYIYSTSVPLKNGNGKYGLFQLSSSFTLFKAIAQNSEDIPSRSEQTMQKESADFVWDCEHMRLSWHGMEVFRVVTAL